MSEDINKCPKCGYDWEAHEFAVPAPYCPNNDEEAAANRESVSRFKNTLERIKSKKWVDPLKKERRQFVVQNKGVSSAWFDYQTGFKTYEEAAKSVKRTDLTYRIIKREIVETVIE